MTSLFAHRPEVDVVLTPPGDDALVLAGRELRADIAVESTARFGDLVWDLMPALVQKHQRRMELDFTTLPQRYRVAWFTGHVATRLQLGAFSDVAKGLCRGRCFRPDTPG